MKQITLLDVKQALRDKRFRDTLDIKFRDDLNKYLQNPGCACNVSLYKKIIVEAKEQLQQYYPNRQIIDLDAEVERLSQNKFSVINCKITELESKLQSLPHGRKQITVARYEDEVTVIVNELDAVF